MADVHLPGKALLAVHAGNMRFDRYDISFFSAMHDASGFDNCARRFMSDCIRDSLDPRLCPMIPFVDMDIGAAKTRRLDLYENFVRLNIGNWNFLNFHSTFSPHLAERSHCCHQLLLVILSNGSIQLRRSETVSSVSPCPVSYSLAKIFARACSRIVCELCIARGLISSSYFPCERKKGILDKF